MNITIQPATQNDYDNFLTLFQEVEKQHRLYAPWKFKELPNGIFPKNRYQKLLKREKQTFLLAQVDNKAVGFIIAIQEETPLDNLTMKERKRLKVESLSVKTEYQRHGIWKLLMTEIEKIAQEKNISEIELDVWEPNQKALNFYKKNWYTTYLQKMRKELK